MDFILALSISYLIFVFLKTNVIEEYSELFDWDLFYYQEYKKFLLKPTENYNLIQYITYYQNNFGTRIFLCPPCAVFWLSLIGCVLFSSVGHVFYVSFLGLLGYYLLLKLR